MTFARINLKAINPEQHIARHYSIALIKDLLGTWEMRVTYGAMGFKGRNKNYYFANQEQMLKQFMLTLRRRFNSYSRIKCSYTITSYNIVDLETEINIALKKICYKKNSIDITI